MAMSMDGHVVEPNGGWSLGSKEDKKRMDDLRLWADAVIVSRASLKRDNPNLFVRSKPQSKKHPRPVIVLHNTKRKIPASLRAFGKPHPAGEFWIPKGNEALLDTRSYLQDGDKIALQWQTFLYKSVKDIVSSLAQRGYQKILLEGGPSLNTFFLETNLIDEIYITIIPLVIGGIRTDRFIQGYDLPFLKKWKLKSCESVKNEIFLCYQKQKHYPKKSTQKNK